VSINYPQFKERVARKLGVLPLGNSLSPEDAVVIAEKSRAVQEQLQDLDIAVIDFEDGIDEAIVDSIIAMVAALLVDDFQLGEPKRSKIAQEGILGLPATSVAERQLRKLLSPTVISNPVTAEYF
jgi:hypothetical protein